MRRATWLTLSMVFVTIFVLVGCAPAATPAPASPTPTTQAVEPSPVPTETETPPTETLAPPTETVTPTQEPAVEEEPEASTTVEWIPDGVISEGEYTHFADFSGIRVWWRNDDTYLYLAMEGDTLGWVAVGIDPEQGMMGANYIFGYVENGVARIWDAYGTAPRGASHPPDEELGGTNDIVAYVGVEEDGVTRFEVQIPLDSGDPFDKLLEPGKTYPMIVAIGPTDEFNAYHTKYAYGELVLTAQE